MLKPKQLKYIELAVQGKYTDREIAEEINVSPKTICEWKKNTEFQDALHSTIRICLQDAAPLALNTMVTLTNSKSDMVKYLAAKDILDRMGFNPVEKLVADVDCDLNITIDYGD